jgi:hypothetical protein
MSILASSTSSMQAVQHVDQHYNMWVSSTARGLIAHHRELFPKITSSQLPQFAAGSFGLATLTLHFPALVVMFESCTSHNIQIVGIEAFITAGFKAIGCASRS